MGNRTKKRTMAVAALVEGEDDDLIQWLNSLSSGARASMIKSVLRTALFGAQPAAPQQPPPGVVELLQQQQRETVEWMQQWIEHIQEQFEQLRAGWLPVEQTTVTDAPQLTEDEADKMAAKMRKAGW